MAQNIICWNSEEDELLIEFVKDHEMLYNVKCKDFKKIHLKQYLWCEIGGILNKTDVDCRKRWSYVRDYYIRRRGKAGTGGEAAMKRAVLLSFLDAYNSSKRSTTPHNAGEDNSQDIYPNESTDKDASQTNPNDDSDVPCDASSDEDERNFHLNDSRRQQSSTTQPPTKKTKWSAWQPPEDRLNQLEQVFSRNSTDCHNQRNSINLSDCHNQRNSSNLTDCHNQRNSSDLADCHNQRNSSNLSDCHNQRNSSDLADCHNRRNSVSESSDQLDETDHFFVSMSKIVKKLPRYERAQLRMQIATLVGNAELQHISKQSEFRPRGSSGSAETVQSSSASKRLTSKGQGEASVVMKHEVILP